ncbi:XRE family transcriptional regulator [Listeria monocytogenes]|uniref:helix-turn-helix domain-containing protein n=1 Tax=Listeria ivanovii TaxID=1638 RepID=UPI0005127DD1|nr:helix-turn-helix transcriptional regulator [Listeria ivanovii]AIS61330.1 XRE family transcriptional regulator [Listeria ivanovii subsp. londoniensis]EAC7899122.1 XRE family transcriptional regulator [Listeria monocytogenes]HAC2026881.1 helix-turn-helix domain-containing protein [Listeria monocytogenes]
MTTFDRIKYLANGRGKSLKDVATEIGLSENIFYTWKKSSPKTDVIQKVADYFNVSVDYLLGRTDKQPPLHELEDAQFLDVEGLTSEDIAKVEGIIRALKEAQRKIDEFENM